MAQLRDNQTSQVLYEGTPLECVAIARQLGTDKVLFDDVGMGFDADAVWQAHIENQDGLTSVAQSLTEDQAIKDQAQAALDSTQQEVTSAEASAPEVAQRQEAIQAGQDVPPLP